MYFTLSCCGFVLLVFKIQTMKANLSSHLSYCYFVPHFHFDLDLYVLLQAYQKMLHFDNFDWNMLVVLNSSFVEHNVDNLLIFFYLTLWIPQLDCCPKRSPMQQCSQLTTIHLGTILLPE